MTFSDEVAYVTILGLYVAVGFFLRSFAEPWRKQLVSALLGIFTAILLCGWETLHSVAVLVGTLFLIKSHSRQTPFLAFVFVFSYLLFFRCSTFFGLPKPSAFGNAMQLLLTLKLIGVAIEIHDYRNEKLQADKSQPSLRFQLSLDNEPTVYDVVCYTYCYVGLFTGPFFKYRTYQDFLNQTYAQSSMIPWKEEIVYRVQHAFSFGALYLVASQFFSVDYVKSDPFYDRSFWFRLLYMVPIFFMARMRFYFAWLLSECSFISVAFGAYPSESKPRPGHGPTVDPAQMRIDNSAQEMGYSFETIRNINPSGSDWSKTVREGMRNWNMTVQWWLANYVHKRWPANLKAFRTAAVLGCSAYWHGIAPGYFGAFLTMPFVMMAEDMMIVTVKRRLPQNLHNGYDWVNWFFNIRSFEYMFMAFALLTWEDTYRWWKSVYFVGHVGCLIIIVACTLAQKLSKVSPGRTKKE